MSHNFLDIDINYDDDKSLGADGKLITLIQEITNT